MAILWSMFISMHPGVTNLRSGHILSNTKTKRDNSPPKQSKECGIQERCGCTSVFTMETKRCMADGHHASAWKDRVSVRSGMQDFWKGGCACGDWARSTTKSANTNQREARTRQCFALLLVLCVHVRLKHACIAFQGWQSLLGLFKPKNVGQECWSIQPPDQRIKFRNYNFTQGKLFKPLSACRNCLARRKHQVHLRQNEIHNWYQAVPHFRAYNLHQKCENFRGRLGCG